MQQSVFLLWTLYKMYLTNILFFLIKIKICETNNNIKLKKYLKNVKKYSTLISLSICFAFHYYYSDKNAEFSFYGLNVKINLHYTINVKYL